MSVDQDTPRKPMPLGAVRSYHPRRGRITIAQQDALDRLWATYGMKIRETEGLIDLTDLFGNNNPVIVEIGFGMGDATAAMALAQPDINIFAIDVHTPGHGSLLNLIEQHELKNVRVAEGDAVELLRDHLADETLSGIRVYFPDPWHKSKHHKRRLIQVPFLTLVTEKLKVGGTVHCATDWAPYAEWMLEELTNTPGLTGGYVPRPDWRPVTKFERQGLAKGHEVADLIFQHTA